MRKNIGLGDSFCRITMGLFMLSKGIVHRSSTISLLGAMEAASGITRFCPVYHILGLNTQSSRAPFGHLHK